MNQRTGRLLSLCLLSILFVVSDVNAKSVVYVSVAGENRIAVYDRDPETGQLSRRSDTETAGEPGALAFAPKSNYLFASIRSEGNLVSFAIDPDTGSLSQLSQVEAGADPAYVAVDNSGTFLLSAYYRAGKVMVHRILANGSIAVPPVQELTTADKAHAIVTDRSNRFAFVPHTGPNVIYQFQFDARTGRLTPGPVPQLQRPENTGPRHLLFHPSKDFVYVSNEQGSSLSVYQFDSDDGGLRPLQTESTLPEDFEGRNSTAHLEVHPTGQFVYVANRGHDSLAPFTIDPTNGRVTPQGQTTTEGTPRSFNISSCGKHLYAAGQATGRLAAFRIDLADGSLTRFATYDVGPRPWWVLAVETN